MESNEISRLLAELEAVLRKQGEKNWIRGVVAARQALEESDGLEQVRSIYATMNQGVGSFADYNVWHDDFDTRQKINSELDRLRTRLWGALNL